MKSKAKTVKEYLEELPEDRRKAIEAVRRVIKKNLPKGYIENMAWGMIGYAVPLKLYPAGYGGKKDVPLPYAALGNQKNYMAVYLMGIYATNKEQDWFRKAYVSTGKKLDMGKGCIRFKKLEDLPLNVIGNAIAMVSVKQYIDRYETARSKRK